MKMLPSLCYEMGSYTDRLSYWCLFHRTKLVRVLLLGIATMLPSLEVYSEPGLQMRPSNLTCLAPEPVTSDARISLTRAFPNLDFHNPVAMSQPRNDGSYWYIIEQDGRVLRFENNDQASTSTVVLDIMDEVVFDIEGGLMGIAFHPDFTRNGYMFLSYTGPSSISGFPFTSYISRFTTHDGGASFNSVEEEILIQFNQPSVLHNNGHLLFGPEGYLYIGSGDGGPLGDRSNNGQNTHNLFSAILRIDVDRGNPYSIPIDNPFANGGGAGEIYAWGLRNPWRFNFDRATGNLWVGDVGENRQEEVNIVLRGRNYGWSIMEGRDCFETNSCNGQGLIDPVETYSHALGCSITGGYVYRGSAISELEGTYLYSDYCTGTVWGLTNNGGNNYESQVLLETGQRVVSFAEDLNEELYLVSFTGEIFSLQSSGGTVSPGSFADRLSDTGCFEDSDPTQTVAGVIPYDVNSPLWSDGAEKERFLAIPDGEAIHIDEDHFWEFPLGTVLVKNFLFHGRYVETRLLALHSDEVWRGYSYEWNEAQTDARLIAADEQLTKNINGQEWSYPTRAQCLQCHNSGINKGALGAETAQLNRNIVYPTTGMLSNQLETFDHIAMFDTKLSASAAELPTLATLGDTSRSFEERARAYLHSNCSSCHREGGSTSLSLDLRYDLDEAEMGVCDKHPLAGNLGLDEARILAPGESARSLLLQRMMNTDRTRMPPLGTAIAHDEGIDIVSFWIDKGGACINDSDGDDDESVSSGGGGILGLSTAGWLIMLMFFGRRFSHHKHL